MNEETNERLIKIAQENEADLLYSNLIVTDMESGESRVFNLLLPDGVTKELSNAQKESIKKILEFISTLPAHEQKEAFWAQIGQLKPRTLESLVKKGWIQKVEGDDMVWKSSDGFHYYSTSRDVIHYFVSELYFGVKEIDLQKDYIV